MENYLYDAYNRYFTALRTLGYYSYKDVEKLLVLDFVYGLLNNYRLCTRKDYAVFERALECLYGTSCLTPYADYLKMGKLRLGDMTEVFCRLRKTEEELRQLDGRGEQAENDHVTMIISDSEPEIQQ